jgi:hypothetical protein
MLLQHHTMDLEPPSMGLHRVSSREYCHLQTAADTVSLCGSPSWFDWRKTCPQSQILFESFCFRTCILPTYWSFLSQVACNWRATVPIRTPGEGSHSYRRSLKVTASGLHASLNLSAKTQVKPLAAYLDWRRSSPKQVPDLSGWERLSAAGVLESSCFRTVPKRRVHQSNHDE